VSELLSVIDATAAIDPHTIGSAGLISARDRLDAVIASRLQAADAIQATVDECGRSTRGWLVEELRRSPTEARRSVFVARSLPAHPRVTVTFAAGDISAEHTRVIVGCLRELHGEDHEWATEVLLEAARSMDPTSLGQVIREIRLRTGVDEDRDAAAEPLYASRWARTTATVFGMNRLDAMLDPDAGRILVAALDALTLEPTGSPSTSTPWPAGSPTRPASAS
jgi:hypothetical protein